MKLFKLFRVANVSNKDFAEGIMGCRFYIHNHLSCANYFKSALKFSFYVVSFLLPLVINQCFQLVFNLLSNAYPFDD